MKITPSTKSLATANTFQYGMTLSSLRSTVPFVAIVLAALFLSVILGLFAIVLPWFYVLGLLGSVVFAVFAWKIPEYSALILLILVTGILPGVPGNTGSLILLVGLLILTLIKRRKESQFWWVGIKPFALPFFLMLFIVLVGVVRALVFQNTPHNQIFNETSPFLYWLLFPVIALNLNSERKINIYVVVLMFIAAYVAVGQFLQAIFGIQVFFTGTLGQAETLDKVYAGATRSTTEGILLLLLGLFISVALYFVKTRNVFLFPYMALCTAGLMFTYGRTLMGSAIVSLLVVAMILGGKQIVKLAIVAGLVLLTVIGALSIYKPEILFALNDRIFSVETEIKSGGSMAYRLNETKTALPKLIDNPLFGIGLGHEYRLPVLQVTERATADSQSRFIHNGYIYVALKLGIPALLSYLLFIAVFFVQARITIRLLINPMQRAFLAAATGLMVLPLITSVFRPEWMSPSSTGTLAICFGLLVALSNLQAKQTKIPAH